MLLDCVYSSIYLTWYDHIGVVLNVAVMRFCELLCMVFDLNFARGVVSGNGKYSTLRIFTPTSFNDIQHGIFA